jgi:hypothetical protein
LYNVATGNKRGITESDYKRYVKSCFETYKSGKKFSENTDVFSKYELGNRYSEDSEKNLQETTTILAKMGKQRRASAPHTFF